MQTSLEKSYIPSCSDCQQNKSQMTKAPGPLHPLPIPDDCGDSVAVDFIGPLPEDNGYNSILTMTDCLGSDYRLIPTRTNASAEDIVLLILTIGTVRMDFQVILSLIETKLSSHISGKPWLNSLVWLSKCPLHTTWKLMDPANELTKLLIRPFISMSTKTKRLGPHSPSHSILYHEYHQCFHWIFWFSIMSRLISSYHPANRANFAP